MTKTDSTTLLFHTIGSLAGRINVPVNLLRQAKRRGADGFRPNNTVDAAELLRWLLTKGKTFSPTVDLESAKTRLAEARADLIVRNGKLAAGELIPTLWAAQLIETAFDEFHHGVRGRIANLTTLLCLCARVPDYSEGLRQVAERLTNDAAEIRNNSDQVRDLALLKLRNGPPESNGKSAWKDFEDRLQAIMSKLSDSARRELHAALAQREQEKGN